MVIGINRQQLIDLIFKLNREVKNTFLCFSLHFCIRSNWQFLSCFFICS